MGVVTALGRTLDQYWSGLIEGRSGVGPLTLFDTTAFKVHFGGQVRDWDADALFGHKEARRLDRFAQFAMVAAESAVDDSGIDFGRLEPHRCGVMIGSGIGGLNEFEEQYRNFMEKGPSRISPFTIPKLMVNAASGQVSIKYGLKGPTSAVATACASAANAIGDAFKLIQYGSADVMITGGSEAAITHMGLGGFASMRALSTRNDDPERASRPFDRDRDGFVLAEGAGLLVLEEESVARARGARIYAELLGYGMSADGTHITAPDEEGRGAARAMSECLRDAAARPLRDRLRQRPRHQHRAGRRRRDEGDEESSSAPMRGTLKVSSTKSQLGHTLGRLRRVELSPPALAMERGRPAADDQPGEPRSGVRPRLHPEHRPRGAGRHVMSNSFGFGGHNASLLIGRYRGQLPRS